MNASHESTSNDTRRNAPNETLVDDTQIDAINDAIRANLGLTTDPEQNRIRLQQAADFVAAVNAQRTSAIGVRPKRGVRARWAAWTAHLGTPRNAWLTAGISAGVLATLVVVGVALFLTQQTRSPESGESAVAAAVPTQPETVFRGGAVGNLIPSADPTKAAARLVASLVALGCGATSREVKATVYVEIDTTISTCHDVLPELAKHGLAPEANGRLAVRFVPSQK